MAAAAVITLSSGPAELAVVPAIGGSIAHYCWKRGATTHHWLRPASIDDIASGDAGRLACFPLVPYSNRIRDGRFAFGGHTIALPLNAFPERHSRHGHGWQAAWSVAEASSDRLALAYEHAADAWPFSYRARQEFVLDYEELRIALSVENTGREAMPVGLGLHPYFPSSPRCRLRARVAAMWATDDEVMPTALEAADPRLASRTGMPIQGAGIDNVFAGWQRSATVAWPEARSRLELSASAPLDFLVVYSPRGKDYFSCEPVSHCTDAFNLAAQGRTDTGMLTLQPGACVSAALRLRPSIGT